MTTVDNHHIVNSHSSVSAINGTSLKPTDGKVVVDEEIDSCEGEDYDEKMFQVALVNSVMDTGGSGGPALEPAPGEMSPRSKERHALRKRRRPGEEALVAPPVPPPIASDVLDIPNDPLNELQHIQDSSMTLPSIHLPPPTSIKQELPPQTTIQQHQNIGVTARGHSAQGTIPKPPNSSTALLPSTTFPAPQQRRPNANAKKKAVRKRKVKPAKVPAKTKVAERLSISVPNPLLASTSPAPSMNHSVLRGRQDVVVAPTSSVPCPLSIPSPLDTVSSMQVKPSKKLATPSYIPPFDPSKLTKVSEASAAELPVTRTRVFSVDLDPSTFDFSDLSSITGGNAEKVSSDADLPIFQGRDRAFSFEVFNFAGGDDLLPNPVNSSQMLQAPSLAPVNVEAPMRRPRGDSIIFDPASFQDGGIHEKNALEKARLRDLLPAAPAQQVIPRHTTQRRAPTTSRGGITGTYSTSQSSNPLPLMLPPGPSLTHASPLVAGQNRHAHAARSLAIAATGSKARSVPTTAGSRAASTGRNSTTNSVQIATLPSSLSAGAASSAQSPPTFQMELLNKDGRIGIYLPEARRLRIARFHAKRKMRIWRKRIKYDCRKKLADSRPRIKGRFVKRSDLD